MKRINMGRAILLGIVLLCMLTGCYSEPFTYEFRQVRDNVEKVEICAYDHYEDSKEVLTQLDETDVDALLVDIQSLPCYEGFNVDGPNYCGPVVIFITYTDGEEEMIGVYKIGWRTTDGKRHTSRMNFKLTDMRTLISKYVDKEILAELEPF